MSKDVSGVFGPARFVSEANSKGKLLKRVRYGVVCRVNDCESRVTGVLSGVCGPGVSSSRSTTALIAHGSPDCDLQHWASALLLTLYTTPPGGHTSPSAYLYLANSSLPSVSCSISSDPQRAASCKPWWPW
jgi:hypothetical protein